MRVIAGQWKGRRLKSPPSDEVRPTTDRVKEAMFNILGPAVQGCDFLDICCGAGGLGIEALSRGAATVAFVDLSRKSLDLVRKNLEICGSDPAASQLIQAEGAAWLADLGAGPNHASLVVVADPPYQSPATGAIMRELGCMRSLPGFQMGIVEYGPRTPDIELVEGENAPWTTRRYGESRLAIIRPGGENCPEGE